MRIRPPLTAGLLAVLAAGPACTPAHVEHGVVPTPTTGAQIRFALRADTGHFIPARVVLLSADSLVFERFTPSTTGGKGSWVRGALPTDSLARLQVQVGRRGNAGRGALIGGAIGLALGGACAIDAANDKGWLVPSPGECFVGMAIPAAVIGLVVGALRRSDVWAPTTTPSRPGTPPVAQAEQMPNPVKPPSVNPTPAEAGTRR